jgi:uncharacterized membrane protein AbrB (regulator of aidB expression)
VQQVLPPDRIERGPAVAVALLTVAAVVGLEIGLVREVRLDRLPDWVPAGAVVALLLLAAGYVRWLLRRLAGHDWRLTPTEAGRLLPGTVTVFWLAGGFAMYPDWWSWTASAMTGLGIGFLFVPWLLERLAERTTPQSSPVSGPGASPR